MRLRSEYDGSARVYPGRFAANEEVTVMTDPSNEECPMPDRSQDELVKRILRESQSIAVIGMSPKPERPSQEVGLYLRDRGYRVFPIHPAAKEIEGLLVYPGLNAMPWDEKVDVATFFVTGDRATQHIEPCAKAGVHTVYFQPGAENPDAEEAARSLGLTVFSGRCIMADHKRLIGE